MSQLISKNPIPNHVAIVPDGNRRWATRKGMEAWQGHEAGAKMIEEISQQALKIGVKYITFWGSSVDNLQKRPLKEKRALLNLYEKYFKKLTESREIYENKTRINVLGRWEQQFPDRLKEILKKGIEKTRTHTNNFLSFLLAYNGDDEIIDTMKKIVQLVRSSSEEIELDQRLFQSQLMTADLPEVDLLIRTGVEGDPHNSAGFMMWHTRNAQYYFSDKMFPDFNGQEFLMAVEDFSSRVRRFGK